MNDKDQQEDNFDLKPPCINSLKKDVETQTRKESLKKELFGISKVIRKFRGSLPVSYGFANN
jgi:hypothetical protein